MGRHAVQDGVDDRHRLRQDQQGVGDRTPPPGPAGAGSSAEGGAPQQSAGGQRSDEIEQEERMIGVAALWIGDQPGSHHHQPGRHHRDQRPVPPYPHPGLSRHPVLLTDSPALPTALLHR
jgi:hypothetical protein